MPDEKISKALKEILTNAEMILSDTFITSADLFATTSFIVHKLTPEVLKIPQDDISDGVRGFFLQIKKQYEAYLAIDAERLEAIAKFETPIPDGLTAEIEFHRKQIPILQELNDWMVANAPKEIPFVLSLILIDSVNASLTEMRSCIAKSALQILHPEPDPQEDPGPTRRRQGKRRPRGKKKDDDKDKPSSEPGEEN